MNQATKLAHWQKSGFDHAILQLETVYARVQKKEKTDKQDAFDGTRHFIQAHVYSADFYFLIFGLSILAFTTRGFAEPGIDYGPWRPVVISLAGVLAGIIPLCMALILFPFHVIFRANLWVLTGLNIVLSATLFSLVEPVIPTYFYDKGVLHFEDLFWKILIFYALALSYLQMRIRGKVCFNTYQKRHKIRTIEHLVPADKRGPLVALSAQDHYVSIITEKGEHLNRMSMKEAIALAPEGEGMQVHRSHWVAFNAMLSLDKTSDRYFVKLRNGTLLPVAKSKVKDVREVLDRA